MKIELWWIGKTKDQYIREGIGIYEKRLKHYLSFEVNTVPDVKNAGKYTRNILKQKEAEQVLQKLDQNDILVLLDERGKALTSEQFASFLQHQMNQSVRKLVFLVGGAFGFDKALYERANVQISLSPMTFSHQMVRLFMVEQLYRAYTIINNEKYHNS